jgi:hypothetical protein
MNCRAKAARHKSRKGACHAKITISSGHSWHIHLAAHISGTHTKLNTFERSSVHSIGDHNIYAVNQGDISKILQDRSTIVNQARFTHLGGDDNHKLVRPPEPNPSLKWSPLR